MKKALTLLLFGIFAVNLVQYRLQYQKLQRETAFAQKVDPIVTRMSRYNQLDLDFLDVDIEELDTDVLKHPEEYIKDLKF